MTANRKLDASVQWAIAALAVGAGMLATLAVANAVNHAGWSPWTVLVGWVAIVAVATILIKLRGSTALGSGTTGPMGGHKSTRPGDGIHGGDSGGTG